MICLPILSSNRYHVNLLRRELLSSCNLLSLLTNSQPSQKESSNHSSSNNISVCIPSRKSCKSPRNMLFPERVHISPRKFLCHVCGLPQGQHVELRRPAPGLSSKPYDVMGGVAHNELYIHKEHNLIRCYTQSVGRQLTRKVMQL